MFVRFLPLWPWALFNCLSDYDDDDDDIIIAVDSDYGNFRRCNCCLCFDGWPMRASFVSTVVWNSSPGAKMMLPVLAAQMVSIVNEPDQFLQQHRDVSHVLHTPQVRPAWWKKDRKYRNLLKTCYFFCRK